MELISEYCISQGIDAMIIMTEEEQIGIDQPKESYFAEYMPDYKEYLYDINKFCGFPGKKMEKKRNHLHYFKKNYSPYEFKAFGPADINDLIEFTLKFENNHNDSEISEYECEEIINVLRNYEKYPFEGILIRKEGRLLGYTFGEKSGDTFIIHAEKGDISYRGIYQAIASELAKYLADKYPEIKYLNREDDMGDESLRKSKESYHPCIYVHKHRYFVR